MVGNEATQRAMEGRDMTEIGRHSYVWAEIRNDGTWWLNLEGDRGWTRVSDIIRMLEEVPKMWTAIIWAVAISAASLTGVIGLIALALFT